MIINDIIGVKKAISFVISISDLTSICSLVPFEISKIHLTAVYDNGENAL